MSITTQHVANFKLRAQLLMFGIVVGVFVGLWAGHQYVRLDMAPNVTQAFNDYLPARAFELVGLHDLTHHRTDDRHANYLYALRTSQNGYWARYFEDRARLAYACYPIGGAIAGALLVILIGRVIGRVDQGDAQ